MQFTVKSNNFDLIVNSAIWFGTIYKYTFSAQNPVEYDNASETCSLYVQTEELSLHKL